jgi:hypothetical protein
LLAHALRSPTYGRHEYRFLVIEPTLLSYSWMCYRFLFLLMQRMSAMVKQFVTSEPFFSSFFLSLLSKKLEIGLLCFWYFYFNYFSFDFLFFFLVLYKGFISFQFSYSILTYHIIYFSLVLILLFSLLSEKLQIGLLYFLYFYFGHYFIDWLFFSFFFS